MKRIAHKTALHLLGWTFIILGCIGLVLPFIPGIPFFLLGIYILSLASLWLWLKIEIVKKRFPIFAYHYNKFDIRISKYIKKAH